MRIDLKITLYIIIFSAVIGFLINTMRPDGLSLIREEQTLVMASDSLIDKVTSDSLTDHTSSNENEQVEEGFTSPIAVGLNKAYELYSEGILFIDSREKADFEGGHIKGSINIPFEDLDNYQNSIESIPKNQPVVIYCAGTDCDLSHLLGNKLFSIGYKKVFIFFGGWNEWIEAKYPVEN